MRDLGFDSHISRRTAGIVAAEAVTAGLLLVSDSVTLDLPGKTPTTFNIEQGNNGFGGSGLAVARFSRRGLFSGARVASAAPLERSCGDDNDNNNSAVNLGDCTLTATLEARAYWIDQNKPMGKQVTTGLGGRIMLVTHGQNGYLFRTAEQDSTDGTGFVIAGPFNTDENSEAYKEAVKEALEARPTAGNTLIEISARPESVGRFYNDAKGAWENNVPLIDLGLHRISSESGKKLWTAPETQHARLCIAGETVKSLLYQVRSIDKVYTGHNGIEPNRPYIENHKVY